MTNKISIMLTDDNAEYVDILAEYLNQQPDFEVIAMARDGIGCLEQLKDVHPDILVMDMIMPNLDGIGVLEKMREIDTVENRKWPRIMILSAVGHEVYINKVMNLGAESYLIKPFSVEVLAERIRELYHLPEPKRITQKTENKYANDLKTYQIEAEITHLMHEIGIPAHIMGYQYLRKSILLVSQDPDLIYGITKKLYIMIADEFNSTPTRVERAIRHAIEVGWNRGRIETLDRLFGYTIRENKGKPTNGEFIAMMTDNIIMQNKKKRLEKKQ